MKKFYLFAVICGLLESGFSYAKSQTDRGGQAFFERSVHQFGPIKRGKKVSTRFNFSNRGANELIITGVQAPCGCATVSFDTTKKYGPGETGYIDVQFDSTDFQGAFVKPITVMTNERQNPDRTLTLAGTVEPEFTVQPPLADFGETFKGQERAVEVKIEPVSGSKFSIEKVKFNQDLLDVSYIQKNDVWSVFIKLKPTVAPGFLKETLLVKNSNQNLPELKIPVRANVKGNLSVSPSYIEFGSIVKAGKSTRPLQFNYRNDPNLQLAKAELNVNGSKLDGAGQMIRVIQSDLKSPSGRQYHVELTNAAEMQGSVHGKLYFQSSDPDQKQLTIDFYAFFR